MNKFKENLCELIKNQGMQQKEIAKAIGISPQSLCNLKTGYNEPNIDTLIAIADYFNVCIDYLVGRQDWY